MESLKIRVGLLPRTWGGWTLNDERFAAYKTYLINELQSDLSTVIKAKDWDKKSKEIQIKYIEKAIQNAKEKARTKIRIEAKQVEAFWQSDEIIK